MDFLTNNLLTILIFLPTVGAIITFMVKGRDAARWAALATTIVVFLLSLLLFFVFDWNQAGDYAWLNGNGGEGGAGSGAGTVQLRQEADWIPAFNIKYK